MGRVEERPRLGRREAFRGEILRQRHIDERQASGHVRRARFAQGHRINARAWEDFGVDACLVARLQLNDFMQPGVGRPPQGIGLLEGVGHEHAGVAVDASELRITPRLSG